MAVLSKHGNEVGRLEGLTSVIAYMEDGKILKNSGDGWKRWRRCKPGVSPLVAFEKSKANRERFQAERPAYSEYKRLLHSFCCNGKRCLVHMTVEMLGNDHDGVWSELNDMLHVDCSFDEVHDLCVAYDAMIAEQNEKAAIAKAQE